MGISTVSQMEIVEIKKKPGSCKNLASGPSSTTRQYEQHPHDTASEGKSQGGRTYEDKGNEAKQFPRH